MAKLEMWRRRISAGTIDNFAQLKAFLQLPETVEVNKDYSFALISNHLQSLSQQFQFYFGDLNVHMYCWACDSFMADAIEILDLPVEEINQLIELSHNTVSKTKHKSVGLVDFWIEMTS